jgi:GrpB-like predicted nucleotidyltransferase (UPF0157 family)
MSLSMPVFSRVLFFRRPGSGVDPAFHFHLVAPSWPMKNELLLRDWLIANPDVAQAYEALKLELARRLRRH